MKVWLQDYARHSCASYWLALHEDAGKVSEWLGNSPGILGRHYKQIVGPDDASAFWAIRPNK